MRRNRFICLAVMVACMVMIIGGIVWAGEQRSQEAARSPDGILGPGFTYQGRLKVGDEPVTDECDLAFRLYDKDSGGAQVGNPITMTVPITNGLFTVMLNEGGEFGAKAFNGERRWLGVKVMCQDDAVFSELGRQELTGTPYALFSKSTASLHYNPVSPAEPSSGEILKWNGVMWALNKDAGDYANVIVVAKQGGDYATVQGALDSIDDNSASNPYLVWVAPGVYTGTVAMKSYVDIQGAGDEITTIASEGFSDSLTGAVVGAANAALSHLSIRNTGGSSFAIGLYNAGNSDLTVSDVSVHVSGGSTNNIGFYNKDGGAGLTVKDSTVYLDNETGSASAFITSNSTGEHYLNLFNVRITAIEGAAGNYTGISGSGSVGGVAVVNADNITIDIETTGFVTGVSSHHNCQLNVENSYVKVTGGTSKGIGISVGTNTVVSMVDVENSQIISSYRAVQIDGALAHEVNIGASMLVGNIVQGSGTVTCVGCYDENYENGSGFTACP
ncbi:MAG: hypothetical protein JXA42_09255 [Anaerolineales bacterium]|nr:hypothetical protein [Anaerolineales bacterium]